MTLIVGLGNPLRGDDGVGVRLAQELAALSLPGGVEVVDGGTQGLGLVSLFEGRERVIVVDAADMGRAPGEFVRFHWHEARLSGEGQDLWHDSPGFSVHEAGLRDALLLAQALRVLPADVLVVGVQPAQIDWDRGLSPEVEASVPQIVRLILEEIDRVPD